MTVIAAVFAIVMETFGVDSSVVGFGIEGNAFEHRERHRRTYRANVDTMGAPTVAMRHSPCGMRFDIVPKRRVNVDLRGAIVNRPRRLRSVSKRNPIGLFYADSRIV